MIIMKTKTKKQTLTFEQKVLALRQRSVDEVARILNLSNEERDTFALARFFKKESQYLEKVLIEDRVYESVAA